MTEQTLLATPSLYELDETAWLEQTAALIGQQRFGEIDHIQLSEYLFDMARRDKREVLSRLTVLLSHLLKWEYQADHKTNSWQITILHQRNELRDLLESQTLENHARAILTKAYDRAIEQAALETGTEKAAFPAVCPWSLEEVVSEE